MASLAARLTPWTELFVLVVLGWLLRRFVAVLYAWLRDRIDAKVPDHLPIGAGEWALEHAFPRRIRVLQAPDEVAELDAYFPTADAVVLSQRVYPKRDPSFWAIAAHELGHAIVHRTTFLFALPLAVARLVRVAATELATLLVVANVLYGRDDLHRFAFQVLAASLVAYVGILVDEAAASGVAMRLLAADARLERRDRLAAAAGLGAAFLTYGAGFVGQLILFAEREVVGAMAVSGRHFVPGPPLDATHLAFVGAALLALIALSASDLVRAARRRRDVGLAEIAAARAASRSRDVWRSMLGLVVIGVVWDQPGERLPIVCAVGVIASRSAVNALLSIGEWVLRIAVFVVGAALVIAAAVVLPRTVLARLAPRPAKPEPAEERPAAPLAPAVLGSDSELFAQMRGEIETRAPWYERAGPYAFPALHLAFALGVIVELAR